MPTNAMKKLILLLLSLGAFLPGPTFAAVSSYDIRIEWRYDFQPVSGKVLSGYKLYKEGIEVCSTTTATDTAMDCILESEPGTYSFTLTAVTLDGTESPASDPYTFILAAQGPTLPPAEPSLPPTPIPDQNGSHTFSFSWQNDATLQNIVGYQIALNDSPLCESEAPNATEISCRADLLQGLMTFSIKTLFGDGSMSSPSHLLQFDPRDYPQIFASQRLTFSWEYPADQNLTGFKIYQDKQQICETSNPLARQLTCNADTSGLAMRFALTAVETTGTETSLSNLLFYSSAAETTPEVLQAMIGSDSTAGSAPLTIAFNARSSTGTISSFSWSFGDGESGTSGTIDHQYSSPGTYTAQLTVTDGSGNSSRSTLVISVTEATPIGPTTPPQAVISSTSALGAAPLTVAFNGEASTAPNSSITLYQWDFGNGSSASGSAVSHRFVSAGTFYTTLTVTNSAGARDTISTPILVTSPPPNQNIAPQAIFSASPSNGSSPLTVSFNATGSKDPDGVITSYKWQFGDGTSATGLTTTHTYTSQATFTARLIVTDNNGAPGATGTGIVVDDVSYTPDFTIELGEISINSNWSRVAITTAFQNPVVIAGPPGFADAEPSVIRLRNISPTGFEIRMSEWDYLDDSHSNEIVSYLVMEKGHFTLPDGSQVEAGTFDGTTKFTQTPFSKAFSRIPVVFTSIASVNEAETISGRIRNISNKGFDYYFREQEKSNNSHPTEAIHFVAWEPGRGSIGGLIYEIQRTPSNITDKFSTVRFQTVFTNLPLLLADAQTTNDNDTSAIRFQDLTTTDIQLKIEEEQSSDREMDHGGESVGYMGIGSSETASSVPAPKRYFTFHWEFTPPTTDIIGFRFYLNNNLICESTKVEERSHSCTAPLAEEATAMTITAVSADGSESVPSNLLHFDPNNFPQLSPLRSVEFRWEFAKDQEDNISGFALLSNDTILCENQDPTSRQLSCQIDAPQDTTTFRVQAIQQDSTRTDPSNPLLYMP